MRRPLWQKAGPAAQLGLIALLLALLMLGILRSDGDARLIGTVAWLDAPPGLTVDAAAKAVFRPGTPHDHRIAGGAELWARLTLRAPATPDDLVVQVQPGQLDRVTLYLPDADGAGWQALTSGDRVPAADRPVDLLPIRFPVPASALGKTLYLHAEGTDIRDISLTADTQHGAEARMLRLVSLHVLLFALLGMAVLIAVLRFVTRQRWLAAIAVGSTLVHFLLALEAAGYATYLMPWTYPHDLAITVLTVLAVLLSLLGHRLYLMRHRPHRGVLRTMDAAICGQAALLPLLLAGGTAWVGPLSVALAVTGALLVTCLVLTARPQRRSDRNLLLMAHGLYLAGATALLISVLTGGRLSHHLFEALGLNNLLLILSILWIDRQHHVRQVRETRLSLQLARSAQAARNLNATVQESFMHMLLHEVRNNLSILQLSLSNVTDPHRRAELSVTIRDLAQTLADTQYETWTAQDNWPVEPRQIDIIDALDRVFEALFLGDRVVLEGDDPDAAVWADAGMLHAVLSCLLRAIGGPSGRPLRVRVTQAEAKDRCRLDFQALPPGGETIEACQTLNLSRRIAERMGGRIECSETTRQVSLHLPAVCGGPV